MDDNPWLLDIHHLNFLKSLLCPNVTCIAVRGNTAVFDIAELQDRAPNIRELCLEPQASSDYRASSGGADLESGWVTSTMERLIYWEHLSTLTITSMFLNTTTAVSLGMIPSLQALKVFGDSRSRWEHVIFGPGSFPHLNELVVKGVPLNDLINFLDQSGSPRRLTRLRLHLVSKTYLAPPTQLLECLIICIHNRHTLVSDFALTQADVLPPVVLQPLAALCLSRIVLRRVEFSEDTKSLLLSLHKGLEHLDLGRCPMPPRFLRDLATAYPGLRTLFVLLDLDDCRGVHVRDAHRQAEGPLHLYAAFCRSLPNYDKEVNNNIKAITRYLKFSFRRYNGMSINFTLVFTFRFVKRLWKSVLFRWS